MVYFRACLVGIRMPILHISPLDNIWNCGREQLSFCLAKRNGGRYFLIRPSRFTSKKEKRSLNLLNRRSIFLSFYMAPALQSRLYF